MCIHLWSILDGHLPIDISSLKSMDSLALASHHFRISIIKQAIITKIKKHLLHDTLYTHYAYGDMN